MKFIKISFTYDGKSWPLNEQKVKAFTLMCLFSSLRYITLFPWTEPCACCIPCWAIKLIGYWTSSCFQSIALPFPPADSNVTKTHSPGKTCRFNVKYIIDEIAWERQRKEKIIEPGVGICLVSLLVMGTVSELYRGDVSFRVSWRNVETLNVVTSSMSVWDIMHPNIWKLKCCESIYATKNIISLPIFFFYFLCQHCA